jgi:hypothetical protein
MRGGGLVLMIIITISPALTACYYSPALVRPRCFWNNKSCLRGRMTPSDLIANLFVAHVFLLGWYLCRISGSSKHHVILNVMYLAFSSRYFITGVRDFHKLTGIWG